MSSDRASQFLKFYGVSLSKNLKVKLKALSAQDYTYLREEMDKSMELKRLITLLHLKPIKLDETP